MKTKLHNIFQSPAWLCDNYMTIWLREDADSSLLAGGTEERRRKEVLEFDVNSARSMKTAWIWDF